MTHEVLALPLEKPLLYHFTGKFSAPSANWTHEDFPTTDYELIVMTKGELYLAYNGVEYAMGEGEYLLLPPVEGMENRRCGYRPAYSEFYWLHFATADERFYPREGEETIAKRGGDSQKMIHVPVQGVVPNMDKLVILMRQLQNNVREGFAPVALHYQTTAVLCELGCQMEQLRRQQEHADQPKQIHHDIMDYVRLHASETLRVADIARHFGYNPKYLSHLFIKLSQTPLKQFILKCKMENASLLLGDTNLSIGEIAQRTGYGDVHNFSRAYKKVMGVSPSDYRQANAQRMLFNK